MAKLSIVIGTYNRLDLLKDCLNSLIGTITAPYEIYITDAGSSDGTIQYLKSLSEKHKNLILIEEGQKLGQAKSLNNVFRTLNSDYTLWLSDDNIALDGMIDLSVSILEEFEEIGMVGLKVKDISGEFQQAPYIGGVSDSGILNVNQGMLRTKLLHSVGYFDEEFKDYGIDSDLTTKVLLSGYQVVYTKDIAVHHNRTHEMYPGAIDNLSRETRRQSSKVLYNQKYHELSKKTISFYIKKYFYILILKWYFYYLNNLLGYSERDWRNVFYTKTISVFDFMKSSGKPFYLIQSFKNI